MHGADTGPAAGQSLGHGPGQRLGHGAGQPHAADPAAADADTEILNAAYIVPDDAVVRRTKDGWRVGSDDLPDLTCAMVLADLIAAETGMLETQPSKPGSDAAAASETGRLRATVGQLEHALLTRIRVEQAIGVLAERHRIKPRQAFEQLRDAARSRGRRVIDIAGDVVASATNPLLQLPDELSRPRSGPRRRQSFGAQ
jgi:ANTAR domain